MTKIKYFRQCSLYCWCGQPTAKYLEHYHNCLLPVNRIIDLNKADNVLLYFIQEKL